MPPTSNRTDPPPASQGTQPRDADIDVFGLTHRGKVRTENQDHFLVCFLHKTLTVRATSLPNPELLEMPSERLAAFAMVADGVGGHDGGEEASRAAVEAVAMYAAHTMECYYAGDPGKESAFLASLQDAAQACHATVLARAGAAGGRMATTLTLAFNVFPRLYLLQVGDSRCYRLRGDALTLLTRDQTLAQALVDRGVLPADRATRSPYSNVLASAIGGEVQPVVTRHDTEPADTILLCTDGLTKHVTDERIRERLLAMRSAEQVCGALMEDALEGGGTDNITVVVGRSVQPA